MNRIAAVLVVVVTTVTLLSVASLVVAQTPMEPEAIMTAIAQGTPFCPCPAPTAAPESELGLEWTWDDMFGAISIQGLATNHTDQEMRGIDITFVARDKAGKFVATASGIMQPDNLAPGESASFVTFMTGGDKVATVEVQRADWH